MRILVSGITGFVGRHLTAELLRRGDRVWGFTADPVEPLAVRRSGRGTPDRAEVFELDLLDPEGVARLVARCEPEVIVHLAGLSHVGESWKRPGDYLRVNFEGTLNLLRAAPGRRLIFASSAEVYGCVPEDEQPLVEDRPLAPRSPYAMTKACAERVALDRGAIVARSFNAVGAGQARTFALPSFAAQLAAIRRGGRAPVLRVGDLSPRRDFVHVGDVVDGYLALIDRGGPGTVYNLATGRATSICEALDGLRRISGVEAEVVAEESRMRPVDIPLLVGDNRRLAGLGWAPRRGLDRALSEIWEEADALRA
jgi:GDP-4-dehydro-6-deoxy-D-mannose reductase